MKARQQSKFAKRLKNKTADGATMLKMNDEVYALRRQIINVLYECKKRGYSLPRVEVRVNKGHKSSTAYAYRGSNVIHFDKVWINKDVTVRTLHELGHAVFGLSRVKGCLLMDCYDHSRYQVDPEESWKIFDKYYKAWDADGGRPNSDVK